MVGRFLAGTAAAVAGAVVGAGITALRPRRVEVAGDSMAPALVPGDRLLAIRTQEYAVGDIVVVPDPRDAARVLVKRIAALPGGRVRSAGVTLQAGPAEVIVLGDNPRRSTDSRVLGPIRMEDLAGRCVYRYAPADRAARIHRSADAPA
jgi:signal peptidase I